MDWMGWHRDGGDPVNILYTEGPPWLYKFNIHHDS